jgi:hypothetical protein
MGCWFVKGQGEAAAAIRRRDASYLVNEAATATTDRSEPIEHADGGWRRAHVLGPRVWQFPALPKSL